MARYRAEKVLIRRLHELSIVFYSRDMIYVIPKGAGSKVIFHRWFAPRGSYTANWGPFRRKLLRYKHLTIQKCFELANRHEILYVSTDKLPKLERKNVKFRDY